jgi:hypothetical protein
MWIPQELHLQAPHLLHTEGAALFLAKDQKQFLTLKKIPLLLMRYEIDSINSSTCNHSRSLN